MYPKQTVAKTQEEKVLMTSKKEKVYICSLYDYTVEVRNRFKGLDLIDRVLDEIWMEIRNIVQETRTKNIPPKRNAKQQNGCLRRPYK